MKHFAFLTACCTTVIALLLAPVTALAQPVAASPETPAGQNCTTDIVSNLPANIDWRDVYMIRGQDGSAWQRAVISGPKAEMTLKEGKEFKIFGTADPLADVEIFLFSPQKDASGHILKPAHSTCLSGGKADQNGLFTASINARAIWDVVGGEVMVDAFFKLGDLWDQQKGAETNQTYFIGTHIPPTSVTVNAFQDIPEGCQTLCQGYKNSSGLQQVVLLDPKKYPEVQNNNFTPVKDAPVALGKFGQTFYAGTRDSKQGDQFELAQLTMKTIAVEIIKQFLLGERGTAGLTSMTAITGESLRSAAAGTGSSLEVQKLVRAIRDALVGQVGSPERDAGLAYMDNLLKNEIKCLPPKCMSPTKQTYFEIFPAARNQATWAEDFLDMLLLWTSRLDPNPCVLDGNQISTELQKNFYDQGHHHRLIVDCSWYMTYTHGFSTPAIIVYDPGLVNLQPKLKGMRIMTSDTLFNAKNGWNFAPGKKNPVYYRYQTDRPITAKLSADSCISKKHIPDFAAFLAEKLALNADEQMMLSNELESEIKDTGPYKVRIADPADIAKRFAWELNGLKANIFQLFFDIEGGTCEGEYYGDPDSSVTTAASAPHDGFETGFLNR